MNWDLIKQYLFVVIRYVLPYAAAWIAAKTGVTTEAAASWIATSATIVMFLWSLFNKARYEEKVNTALNLPSTATKDTLKDVIAAGNGVGATEKA
ncbi:MAG TPA: hypothetical protein VGO43_00345 [Pyrinomonadaceae bacterium]|jgi:hypothetical protein|nr:hypothetical protein [Pyrinomonadaceae bacterium]